MRWVGAGLAPMANGQVCEAVASHVPFVMDAHAMSQRRLCTFAKENLI
jgi:hypothetical protein